MKAYRTYDIRSSAFLTARVLVAFLLAVLGNLRWIFVRSWTIKQRASLAFVLSKAKDKNALWRYFSGSDPTRLGHAAAQIYLISQAANVQLDVVQDEFEITIEADGRAYRFRMAPVLRPGRSPFVHDLYPLTDLFLLRSYDKYPFEGGIVIDVGGYVGDTAVYFAKNRARKVYSYEPNPVNYSYAVANIALNGVSDRVEAANCGVASGLHRLLVPRGAGGAGSMHGGDPEGIAFQVETVHPAQLFARDEIVSLMKIDCKGCEKDILRDCLASLREKVRHLIIEVERLNRPERARVISDLTAAGFRLDKSDEPFDLLYFSNPSLSVHVGQT